MSRRPAALGDIVAGPTARYVPARPVTPDEQRAAARVLIAIGLRHPLETHARSMARDVCEALGLVPPPPPPYRQSPLTGRRRPFTRQDEPEVTP